MVQTELRRTFAFLGVSQWALVLVGLQSMNLQSVSGAALQITVHGLTLAGLGVLTRSIEIRTGSSDHARLGGLSQASPRMAVLFLLLGCANVGFPPTLGFVGEDLLLHGMLGVHPILAVGLLLATVLNGITVMMAFKRVFLGPWRKELGALETVRDLLPRERFAVLALTLVVCLAGIYPRYLLSVSTMRLKPSSRTTYTPYTPYTEFPENARPWASLHVEPDGPVVIRVSTTRRDQEHGGVGSGKGIHRDVDFHGALEAIVEGRTIECHVREKGRRETLRLPSPRRAPRTNRPLES